MAATSFNTRTALATGLKELFKKLEDRLELTMPVNVYLAGGMAVHLYVANRVTTDVDAEFGARLHLPHDLMVEITLEDGTPQVVYLDTNYNSTFALMHEDYLSDAIPVELGIEHIRVNVLAPVDLAVSKIARLADNDKADIEALVREGLTSAAQIEKRALEAIGGYVGGMAMLRLNVRDAVALAREAEEFHRRAEALPALKDAAGAAYTFWVKASAALSGALRYGDIDWVEIERQTMRESIGQNGQTPASVVQALCEHSPAASSPQRRAQILHEVELCANAQRHAPASSSASPSVQ